MTFVNAAIFEDDFLPLRLSSTDLRLNVKGVTKSSDEYKLYLLSPVVLIPSGKLERLYDDLIMEHSKHLLEEHGSRSPGSPKPHSREKTSQRLLLIGAPFLCSLPFWEPIFVLHVTRLLRLELELEK